MGGDEIQPSFSVLYPQRGSVQTAVITRVQEGGGKGNGSGLGALLQLQRAQDRLKHSTPSSSSPTAALLLSPAGSAPLLLAWWDCDSVPSSVLQELEDARDGLVHEILSKVFVVVDRSQDMLQRIEEKVSQSPLLSLHRRLCVSWPNHLPHDVSDPLDGPLWHLHLWDVPSDDDEEKRSLERAIESITETRSELKKRREAEELKRFLEASADLERRSWWSEERSRQRLLSMATEGGAQTPQFVYHLPTIVRIVGHLRESLTSVDRLLFAIKANSHPTILCALFERGVNFECVSPGEIGLSLSTSRPQSSTIIHNHSQSKCNDESKTDHLMNLFPEIDPSRILFTPNFAPRSEYEFGFEKKVNVTIDCLHPVCFPLSFVSLLSLLLFPFDSVGVGESSPIEKQFEKWTDLLRDKEIFIRIDPGTGDGHHRHVVTAGEKSKFGIHLSDVDHVASLALENGIKGFFFLISFLILILSSFDRQNTNQ